MDAREHARYTVILVFVNYELRFLFVIVCDVIVSSESGLELGKGPAFNLTSKPKGLDYLDPWRFRVHYSVFERVIETWLIS